ncbi:MAG: TetR/AcrR family transcriptional regulator [Bacteroidetes bacterium]|nr:TetR/AcrR family transcriptional regulator [Bacteroidota bacterium]
MSDFSSKQSKEKWLEEGYRQFALYGPQNLSIKKISEALGSSRASFYHFFGDMDVFTEELLAMHWDIAEKFNEIGKTSCNQLFPDLYDLLAENPVPLQFSMQLFHHRSKPAFNFLFIKTYEASAKTFLLYLFAEHYSLTQTEREIFNLWITVGEAWYSRLNKEDLSSERLQKVARDIMDSVIKFANSQLYAAIKLQDSF